MVLRALAVVHEQAAEEVVTHLLRWRQRERVTWREHPSGDLDIIVNPGQPTEMRVATFPTTERGHAHLYGDALEAVLGAHRGEVLGDLVTHIRRLSR
jgi:hypothetical protein